MAPRLRIACFVAALVLSAVGGVAVAAAQTPPLPPPPPARPSGPPPAGPPSSPGPLSSPAPPPRQVAPPVTPPPTGPASTAPVNAQPAPVLTEGVIAQVAATGQPLIQVSATERAIRNLPVALAAVPLVNGGRVEAVLVAIRRHSEPFVPAERDVLVALAPVAAAALQTAEQTRTAMEKSLSDPLTGVGNRRRFDAELSAALSDDRATALCIVDLDHFKTVNDTYGHPAGDALLKGVAAGMQAAMRPGDSVYRIGGEEFALLLRHTTFVDALDVAERVRSAIAEEEFDVNTVDPLRATASIGGAVAAAR